MQELSNLVQPRPSPHQQETKQQETSLLSRRTTCSTGRPPGYRSLCCWRLDCSWEWWWDRGRAGAWLVLRRAVAGRVSQWRSVTPTTSDGPVNTEDSYNMNTLLHTSIVLAILNLTLTTGGSGVLYSHQHTVTISTVCSWQRHLGMIETINYIKKRKGKTTKLS